MLSLERCRGLLPAGEAQITDTELEQLRGQLYQLAHMALDLVVGERHSSSPVALSVTTLDSDPEDVYDPGARE